MSREMLIDKTLETQTGITGTNNSASVKLEEIEGFSVVSAITEEVATLTGSAYLQASHDDSTFVTIGGTTQTISGTGNLMWNVTGPQYKYFRVVHAITGGTAGFTVTVQGLGDDM